MFKIDPCPFCGGDAEIYSEFEEKEDGMSYGGAYVCCMVCKSEGPILTSDGDLKPAELELNAIKLWNGRV